MLAIYKVESPKDCFGIKTTKAEISITLFRLLLFIFILFLCKQFIKV